MIEIKLKAYYKNNRGEYTETKLFGDDITPINDVLREYKQSDYVISQWTGLTDKNGVEVYDGYIIKTGDNKYRGVVEFEAPRFVINRYKKGVKMASGISFYYQGIEVIGNIYENIELLKSTQ